MHECVVGLVGDGKGGGGGVMEVDAIRFVIKLNKVHVFVELEHPPYTFV